MLSGALLQEGLGTKYLMLLRGGYTGGCISAVQAAAVTAWAPPRASSAAWQPISPLTTALPQRANQPNPRKNRQTKAHRKTRVMGVNSTTSSVAAPPPLPPFSALLMASAPLVAPSSFPSSLASPASASAPLEACAAAAAAAAEEPVPGRDAFLGGSLVQAKETQMRARQMK